MGLSGEIKSFLLEKFWTPITDESVFYNPFNTALYSALFALAAAYIAFPALKKLEVELDRDLFTGLTPFVFLGGAVRSLKDIDALDTILLETPFIYILMFCLTFTAIYLSRELAKQSRWELHHILFATGTVLLTATLPFFSVNNLEGLIIVAAATAVWIIGLYTALKIFRPELLRPEFYVPVGAHYMDASVTAAALLFPGTAEKHVLARFFIDSLGPFKGMFLMKTLIIVPAVYYIMRDTEGDKRRYYLFLISLLGFAIATRNLLSFITLT